MTPRSLARLQKSTTGRFIQRAMRVLDAVAPAAPQRLAFRWFLTPKRLRERPFLIGPGFSLQGNGPELKVWDWGDGRTVLLVHGWNGNAAQLSGFVTPLLREGCYGAAPDLPAHGASGGEQTTVRGMADALLRLGRRVGPVHAVIAHSFGAAATVIALAEGLGAERAVLIAPPIDLLRYARHYCRGIGLSPTSETAFVERLSAAVGGRETFDILQLAKRMTARMLVLHDPADREVPIDDARALVRAWPGARLEAIAGAGHTKALRNPDVITRAVGFIAGPEPLALTA